MENGFMCEEHRGLGNFAGGFSGEYNQYQIISIWLVVWNMIFLTFHSVGNFIIPTDKLIFFRGIGIPPTSYPWDILWDILWEISGMNII